MELTTFTSNDFGRIRAMEVNGTPAFVGKDVAECLGYSNASKDIIRELLSDENEQVFYYRRVLWQYLCDNHAL